MFAAERWHVSVCSIVEKDKNASLFIDLTYQIDNLGCYHSLFWQSRNILAYHFPFHFWSYLLHMPVRLPNFWPPIWHLVPCYMFFVPCIQMWDITAAPTALFLQEYRSSWSIYFNITVGFKDWLCSVLFCGPKLSKVATENQVLLVVFCTSLYFRTNFPD